jgi:mannosyltransferase OCH1-like enzyme
VIKSYENFKSHIFTNNEGIPKIIIKTGSFNISNLPIEIIKLYKEIIEENPLYTLFYFDDDDRLQFIKDNYEKRYVDAYFKLLPKAYQADFFRYLILFKYGGVYMDFSMKPLITIDKIIKSYTEVYVRDQKFMNMYNAFIATTKFSQLLNDCIKKCLYNIENENYGDNVLCVTSPSILGETFIESNIFGGDNKSLIKTGKINNHLYIYTFDASDKIHIKNPENGELVIKNKIDNHYNIIYGDNVNLLHYSNFWNKKKVFKNERYLKIEKIFEEIYGKKNDENKLAEFHLSNMLVEEIKLKLIYGDKKLIITYKDLLNIKFDKKDTIPKIIFRTGNLSLNSLPESFLQIYYKELLLNPNYVICYFDDNDCKQSINDSNDDNLKFAYNNLIPTAFKADIWRYYILYKYGGVYIDFTHSGLISYDEIIKNNKEVFVKDTHDNGIYNAFMCSEKGNPIFKEAINLIYKNVVNNTYKNDRLEYTGPKLLERAYLNTILEKFNYKHLYNISDDNIDEINNYRSYIADDNNNKIIDCRAKNHYNVLYNKNAEKIRYENLVKKNIIYKDERWIFIEKLYDILLNREADLLGVYHYYLSNKSVYEISKDIENSEEYKNKNI